MLEKNRRIEWVDIAKGIGVLLVILGHCLDAAKIPFQYIFTFHMPLFFFMSGFVFRKQLTFRLALQKRVRALLTPFAVLFLFGLIVTLIMPFWRKELTFNGIFQDFLLANPNAIHNSSIWFLSCLFFTTILYEVLTNVPNRIYRLGICSVIYICGILYARNAFSVRNVISIWGRLPFDWDVVPAALILFMFGHLFREILWGVYNDGSCRFSTCTRSIVIVCCFAVVGFMLRVNGYVNMHGLAFHDGFMFLVGGMAGTLGVIELSKLIEGQNGNFGCALRTLFNYYGRNSLLIFGTQSTFIRLYLEFCNRNFNTRLALYRFPMKHTIISTLLVAFVLCPAICFIIKSFKKYCGKLMNIAMKVSLFLIVVCLGVVFWDKHRSNVTQKMTNTLELVDIQSFANVKNSDYSYSIDSVIGDRAHLAISPKQGDFKFVKLADSFSSRIFFNGWAIRKGADSNAIVFAVALQNVSTRKIYRSRTNKCNRQDVAKKFKDQRYVQSGFNAVIDVRDLKDKGEYRVILMCKIGKEQSMILTNKYFIIKDGSTPPSRMRCYLLMLVVLVPLLGAWFFSKAK